MNNYLKNDIENHTIEQNIIIFHFRSPARLFLLWCWILESCSVVFLLLNYIIKTDGSQFNPVGVYTRVFVFNFNVAARL